MAEAVTRKIQCGYLSPPLSWSLRSMAKAPSPSTTMNIWNRFRTMTINTWTRLWNVLLNIWKWLCNTCYWIFYKKPLLIGRKKGLQYHYLTKHYWYAKIVAIICWGIPWIFLSVWYIIIVQGCTSITIRGLLEEICVGPYLSPENEVPWYLDLWDPQGVPVNHSKIHTPSYLESIMTGHMKLRDTNR